MELVGFGPGRELCDKVELSEELTHHLTGIVSPTQHFKLPDDTRDGVLGLGDRRVGIVLPVALQALLMFEKFFPEKIGEALASWREVVTRRPEVTVSGCLTTTLEGHQ